MASCLAAWAAPSNAEDNFSQLKALIETGRFDEARVFAARATDDPNTNAVNLAFANALILKAQRHYAEAAAAMRAILSAYPNLTRVRGELADTLLRMGDTEGAKFNFQLLADSASDNSQRSFYERYLTAIRQERPWTLDAYVAIAPSTNINNGISGNDVIIGGVPFDATSHKGKSGIGATFGVAGTYRFDFTPAWALTVGGQSSGNLYADSSFDQVTGSVFGELAYTTPKWRFGFGLTADRTLAGWKGFNQDYGPQVSLSRDFGRAGTLIGTAGWKKVGYDGVAALSGDATDLALIYRKSLSPSSSYGLGFAYTHFNAEAAFNGYDGYKSSIEIYKELRHGLLGSAQIAYQWRDYSGNFPLMGVPREDGQLSVDLAVTFRNWSWHGFAPKVEYTYTHNASNVDLYDFDSHAIGFYLTKKY